MLRVPEKQSLVITTYTLEPGISLTVDLHLACHVTLSKSVYVYHFLICSTGSF